MTRLDKAARARVLEAKRKAHAELAESVEAEPAAELVTMAGIPSSTVARRLFAQLSDELGLRA
jgi:hypothetical protein